ncbi:MAG: histidinol dehydrogenase [Pseudomonadota bacterium]
MPTFLNTNDAGFDLAFETFLNLKRDVEDDVDKAAAKIIADVRARGIDAVLELTERFDRLSLTPDSVAFSATEINEAIATVSAEERSALELAAERIRSYHERQLPQDASWVDASGATLGWRWTAVEAAGLYVPGGLASYPSSVLMNAIPARVAGVERLIICAPTPDGATNALVLLAARLSGVSEIYRIGGAQAIAAMAYGADPISPVDKITGPGNAYVAAAKRRVFGQVGIDMIAGPSEVLIIADGESDPDWVALDLLAQAEHDANAQSILITDNRAFGQAVSDAVDRRLETLARREIARASWRDYGAIIEVKEISEACALSDRIAPEHLEIQTKDPEVIAAQVKHAGAIFLGAHTPEAIGDYVGGPNHVLPTSRSARFSSGLSALDFMKRTTLASMTPAALKEVGPAAETLAKSESLEAHGLSVSARLERLN